MPRWTMVFCLCAASGAGGAPADELKPATPGAKILYAEDFERVSPGDPPEAFMVLNGKFVVKQEEKNRVLELPGGPLDSMGLLFGAAAKEGICVSARIRGEAKGKLMPAFGVGLNGAGGWRLQAAPMRKALELVKADAVKASVPWAWVPDAWIRFRLQSRRTGEKAWTIEGKAWAEGSAEPAEWPIVLAWSEEPSSGRPSVWGMPFSDLPIQFDDLQVTAVAGE